MPHLQDSAPARGWVRLVTSGRWPWGDEEGLGADADRAAAVGENGRGEAGAARGDGRLGVQADPLARCFAVQVDGELRVDEVPAGDVQLPGDAVAAVGDRQHPL